MNIAAILEKCPKGTKLYSTVYGEVEFVKVQYGENYAIHCIVKDGTLDCFTSDGRIYCGYDAECVLFPSKDQRDWNKFIVPNQVNDQETKPKLKPFDKVLVRNADTREWIPDFFIKERRNSVFRFGCIVTGAWKQCIPYEGNEHLLGTTNNPEE
jgi:hypothetical protein